MTPARSSRAMRSPTAGGDMRSSAASLRWEMRASVDSRVSRRRSISSRWTREALGAVTSSRPDRGAEGFDVEDLDLEDFDFGGFDFGAFERGGSDDDDSGVSEGDADGLDAENRDVNGQLLRSAL